MTGDAVVLSNGWFAAPTSGGSGWYGFRTSDRTETGDVAERTQDHRYLYEVKHDVTARIRAVSAAEVSR